MKIKIKPSTYHDAWYLIENSPINAVRIAIDAMKAGIPELVCQALGDTWLELDQRIGGDIDWPDDWDWLEKIGEGLYHDHMYQLPSLFYRTESTTDHGGEWELDEDAVFRILADFKKKILDQIYEAIK